LRPSDRRPDRGGAEHGRTVLWPACAVAGQYALWPGAHVAAPRTSVPCEILGALRTGGVRGKQIPRDRLRLCYWFPEGEPVLRRVRCAAVACGGRDLLAHTVNPPGRNALRCPGRLVCGRIGQCAAGGHCTRILAGLCGSILYPSSDQRFLLTLSSYRIATVVARKGWKWRQNRSTCMVLSFDHVINRWFSIGHGVLDTSHYYTEVDPSFETYA